MNIPNWVKRVFCSKEEFAENYLPPSDNILPTPKVMPPKPELDISEPVLDLVENFKKHPHLWKVRYTFPISYNWFSIEDVRNKEVFNTFDIYPSLGEYPYHTLVKVPDCKWMISDEQKYCSTEYEKVYDMKMERMYRIRAIRKEITDNNERNRLKGVYQ